MFAIFSRKDCDFNSFRMKIKELRSSDSKQISFNRSREKNNQKSIFRLLHYVISKNETLLKL